MIISCLVRLFRIFFDYIRRIFSSVMYDIYYVEPHLQKVKIGVVVLISSTTSKDAATSYTRHRKEKMVQYTYYIHLHEVRHKRLETIHTHVF